MRALNAFSLACLFVVVALFTVFTIVDRDIGFHLRTGELIWQSGTIPTADPFSYVAQGRPWVDSHWLFQLLAYAAYSLGSFAGLVSLRALAVATLVTSLFAACYKRGSLPLTLGLVLIGVVASLERFILRPDLFTIMFLAIFVAGSERLHERPRAWLVALPLLEILWTNTHGLAILGPIYLGLRFAGDLLDFGARRLGLREFDASCTIPTLRRRGAVALLCGLAVLANANGIAGILYPFQLFLQLRGEVSWFPGISELNSPLEWPIHFIFSPIAFYWLLVGLSALGLVANARRLRFGDILPWAAFLFLSLEAVRNIPLFAVVTLPVLARALRDLATRAPARLHPKPGSRAVATALCLALLTLFVFTTVTNGSLYRTLGWRRTFGVGDSIGYPNAEVLSRLRAAPGRILNDPNWGGYLIWRLYPDKQVAVDGRWEIYGELLPGVRSAFANPRAFSRFARAHDVRTVVVERGSRGIAGLTPRMMKKVPDFRLTLKTREALLYQRSTATHAPQPFFNEPGN